MSKQGGSVSEIFNGPQKVTFGGRVLGFTKDGINVEIEGGEWEAITVDARNVAPSMNVKGRTWGRRWPS